MEKMLEHLADGRTVDSDSEVFQILEERFRDGRWAFRGHSDANFDLCTSLERLSCPGTSSRQQVEERIRSEFQRRTHHYVVNPPNCDEPLEWLALMQHHGAPTRLLDWTESPYVAAFFAAVDEPLIGYPGSGEKYSAIWAVDLDSLKKEADRILRNSGWGELDKRDTPSNKDFMRVFFHQGDPPGGSHGVRPAIIAPVKPFRLNERLTIQQGIFLCPSTVQERFETILQKMIEPAYVGGRAKSEWLYKLMFRTEARREILQRLLKMNISYATLFPGLDGFARSLKTDAETGIGRVPGA